MLIISSREFRANQKSYFERIDNGEEVIIKRQGKKSYKITPITEDDTVMSKEEFIQKINKSLQEIKEGKSITLRGEDEINKFLDSL